MNLKDKKVEFAALRPLLTERHAAVFQPDILLKRRCAESTAAQIDCVTRVIHQGMQSPDEKCREEAVWLALSPRRELQLELDELRLETFDTPSVCSADFYQIVIESIGFECVATYPVENEKIYTFARPDGLFLTWNTHTQDDGAVMRGAASLNFQWVGYELRDQPDGVSGQFYMAANEAWIYEGSHDAREGVCATIEKLTSNGNFCSPYSVHTDSASLEALVSPLDWKHLRALMQGRPGFDDSKLRNEMHYVAEERYKGLPLWSQQMLRPMRFEEYYRPAYGRSLE